MDYFIEDEQDQSPLDEHGYFFLNEQGDAITSSSTIANILGVSHPDVMRAIMIIRNSGSAGIGNAEFFRPTEDWTGELCYSDSFQIQPVYEVTLRGFYLIAPYFYSEEQGDQEIEKFYSNFEKMDSPLRELGF